MFSTIAIIALFVQTTFVNGQSRPSEGCASVMAETDCVGYKGCKWFLGACTEKPLVNCWDSAKTQQSCNKIAGCKWFSEPVEYMPPGSDAPTRTIQCRDHTVCDVFITPANCNSKSWCGWVDGKCQVYGTEPSEDWFPQCWNVGTYPKTCKFQKPECKWFSVEVSGENVVYGCRHTKFCDFHKGEDIEYQCSKNKYCQYKNGQCSRIPTASPTTSPTASPTASPTKKPTPPTKAPIPTKAPTNFPTTRSPTTKPTSKSPTIKPSTPFPSA